MLPISRILNNLVIGTCISLGIVCLTLLIAHLRQGFLLKNLRNTKNHLESIFNAQSQVLDDTRSALTRLERINTMAVVSLGLAHDINNLHTVIINDIEILESKLDSGEGIDQKVIESLKQASAKAGLLTKSVMSCARDHPSVMQSVDLMEELTRLWPLLETIAGKSVRMELELAGDSAAVLMVPGTLEQVLINLVSNARDALPEGGVISMHLCQIGGSAYLEIADTGIGIQADVLRKLFEPFFTTKREGHGLGLANAKSIIESVGGRITVSSYPGVGTSFLIQLPIHNG